MRKKIIESFSIIGGTILSLASYFTSGENMSTTTLTLVIIGTILVVAGVLSSLFIKEKHLSIEEINITLKKRQEYISELKNAINRKTSIIRELATKASVMPLTEYRDRYLKHSWLYKLFSKLYFRDKTQAILSSLHWSFFSFHNRYLVSLIETNNELKASQTKYEYIIAEISDKKLNKILSNYWRGVKWNYSRQIFKCLSVNDGDIRNEPLGMFVADVSDESGNKTLNNQYNRVISRMNELVKGEDLKAHF